MNNADFDKLLQNLERVLGFIGLGIIGWMIYRLGPRRIAQNLHAVSWGFFLMAFLKGARYFAQTVAWKLILAQERTQIGFWKLFRINLEGESLNYITITRVGGEAYKAIAIRDKVSLAQSAASVIVLKFCIMLGFWITIAGGFISIFLTGELAGEIKKGAALGLALLTFIIVLISWVQKRGMFRSLSWILQQFQTKREWVKRQVLRLTRLDNEILETYRSKPIRVFAAVLLCVLAWIEELVFVWLVFHFMGIEETWFLPTVVGTLALAMNSAFFFVPWRAGTQEGTMVLAFNLLGLSEPMGLSMALLKRLREIVWVFVGLSLFAVETTLAQVPNSPQ